MEKTKERAAPQTQVSPTQTADYIAAHLKDLTMLARTAKMDRLVYFLEMAQIEAGDWAEQIRLKS